MAYDPAVVNPTGKHRPKRRHHGEGSRPFKVTDTRRRKPWRCDLRLGRDPVTGRLRTRSFWGTSAGEAERLRDEYRKRLRRAGSPEGAERTVAALLADWMAERRPDVDPSTARRYSAIIDQHLVPTLGHLVVTDVTQADVATARASWTNQRKGKGGKLLHEGKPLSAASSNIALGILREAFGPLGRQGLVADPTADVKRRRRPSSAAVYLTPEQARTLLAAIENDPLALVVRVALAVGPRRGEILGMRWPDLDLDAGTWTAGLQLRHIPTEARRPGEGPYRLVEPKAGHSMGRVVSLPAFVVADLKEHKAAQRAIRRRAAVWVKPGDLVFCDDIGQALPPGSVTRRFERIARAALGMHLRFHDLRHSAATIMLAMGVAERVVQDVLGHSSGATTRGYTHVVRTLGEDAARRMDGAMADRMAANDG